MLRRTSKKEKSSHPDPDRGWFSDIFNGFFEVLGALLRAIF